MINQPVQITRALSHEIAADTYRSRCFFGKQGAAVDARPGEHSAGLCVVKQFHNSCVRESSRGNARRASNVGDPQIIHPAVEDSPCSRVPSEIDRGCLGDFSAVGAARPLDTIAVNLHNARCANELVKIPLPRVWLRSRFSCFHTAADRDFKQAIGVPRHDRQRASAEPHCINLLVIHLGVPAGPKLDGEIPGAEIEIGVIRNAQAIPRSIQDNAGPAPHTLSCIDLRMADSRH